MREVIFVKIDSPNNEFLIKLQHLMNEYGYQLSIVKEDLRDDEGKSFGFSTHMFRRSYGAKLTELHLDDSQTARTQRVQRSTALPADGKPDAD